ncbi:MAG TPA: hypothetical protein DCY20_11035 [Firmicutes bacterium]|nr:hypothetical protein [Bacillota bacterium]
MYNVFETPIFGILLTILAFNMGVNLSKKLKSSLVNPLLMAVALIIVCLVVFNIPLKQYQIGGNVLTYFLSPLTIVLAIPMYRQWNHIKQNLIPIMIGICSGIFIGTVLTYCLGRLLSVEDDLLLSIIPKSITTPMAISLSNLINGTPSVTTIFVVITGVMGAIMAPIVFRLYPTKNKIAKGVGIGAAAHAIGTTKAMEMGETEGASSSASIGLTGTLAIILIPIILDFLMSA